MTAISFPPPAPLMSMNSRQHWAHKMRETRTWRAAANIAARQALKPAERPHPPCTITIELPVKDNRRRDPMNYTPVTKACIDGLVDAGLWDDDTPAYVTTTEPQLSTSSTLVTITLTPRAT